MNASLHPHLRPLAHNGFSMIELLIALLIGLFLLGGLSALVQDNRRTSVAQAQLARLQDEERLALSLMTAQIQQAGYFPDPTTNTAATALPAVPLLPAGVPFFGQSGYAGAAGDILILRYATANGDGILNCMGLSNVTPGIKTSTDFYFVQNGQLTCDATNGLVGDYNTNTNSLRPNTISISKLVILYGIDSTSTGLGVNMYKSALQMAQIDYSNVKSIQFTLTFTNPLWNAANPAGQAQFVSISRVVGIMGQVGI